MKVCQHVEYKYQGGTLDSFQGCEVEVYGEAQFCFEHQLVIDSQWDKQDSDPVGDIYRAMGMLSPDYQSKKDWGLKLSKYLRRSKP